MGRNCRRHETVLRASAKRLAVATLFLAAFAQSTSASTQTTHGSYYDFIQPCAFLSEAGDNPAGSPPTEEALAANVQPVADAEPAATPEPAPLPGNVAYCWSILPDGLIYHSYLAGPKEPRFASAWLEDRHLGSIWDLALGFRQGILRTGPPGPSGRKGSKWILTAPSFPAFCPGRAMT